LKENTKFSKKNYKMLTKKSNSAPVFFSKLILCSSDLIHSYDVSNFIKSWQDFVELYLFVLGSTVYCTL